MSGSGSTSGDAAAAAAGSAAAAAPQRSLHDEIVDFVKAVTGALSSVSCCNMRSSAQHDS